MNTVNSVNKPLSEKEQNRQLRKENIRLHQRIKKLEKQNARQKQELEALREDVRFLKSRLIELQEMLFKKKSSRGKDKENDTDDEGPDPGKVSKGPGAPAGHPGTTREVPKKADKHEDVRLEECPHCHAKDLSLCKRYEPHYQEDIVKIETEVTRYRHHYYYCSTCKKVVHGLGRNELANSYIGPRAKSLSSYSHHQMAMPYRNIRLLFSEIFSLRVNFTSCIGFDRQIRNKGRPIYEEMKNRLKNEKYIHADETGWKKDWLWCFVTAKSVIYSIFAGRGQKEVEEIFGKKIAGVLISDFLSAYSRIECRKQRCLVHLLRLIKKWHLYFSYSKKLREYFSKLKKVVKKTIKVSNNLREGKTVKDLGVVKADIKGQLKRLLEHDRLKHPRAERFRKRMFARIDELTVCLDNTDICSHNNIAERHLRPNVIMRKITFGNRSDEGKRNHETITSLIQTARIHKIDPLQYLHVLATDQPQAARLILSS